MAAPCRRTAFGLLRKSILSTKPNTLLPRWQRAGLADVQSPLLNVKDVLPESNSEPLAEADMDPSLSKLDPALRDVLYRAPLPKSLQAIHLQPIRRKPQIGLPVCNLQMRSYSIRNLEFFADFAMRVAYYLNLPARGPVPLPRITERWTVPRSNFVHKKSQENFERVTLRRLIQIQDGHPEVVQCWLGYLEKRSYHGIGMKANIFEFEALGVGKRMDKEAGLTDQHLEEEWGNFGMRLNVDTAEKVEELLGSEAYENPKKDIEGYYRPPVEIKRKK